MLKPNFIKPSLYLTKKYQNKIIIDNLEDKIHLIKTFVQSKKTNTNESNLDVADLLNKLFYSENYKIQEGNRFKNASGELDLTITDIQQEIERFGVILELKNSDSDQMVNNYDFFKRSFYQAVHYYKSDKSDHNNTSKVKFIIITNNLKWFFIKTSDLDDAISHKICDSQAPLEYPFSKNKSVNEIYSSLERFFKNICEKPKNNETSLFDFNGSCIDVILPFTSFDLKRLFYDNDTEQLELFLKMLSDQYLFNKVNTVEKNALDKKFYNELLYIIGLQEEKKKTKGKISFKQYDNNFSFLALTQKAITKRHKTIKGEELFELSLELVMLWINRLLFIQLYSSILLKYKIINKPILNDTTTAFDQNDTTTTFDNVEELFSEVLQGCYETSTFVHVPYINSSLFLQEDCESLITIDNLHNEIKSNYYEKTVLSHEKLDENDNILKYFIKFLNSCDVIPDDTFQTCKTKPLINPSILGKIFEKINGYKDGSFYTPSYITEYIANATIEKTLIKKFNQNGLESDSIEKLKKEIFLEDKQDVANEIFDSITIVDPAVGSGHFLISSLNAMLLYKAKLGLFETIKPNQLEIIDDTLVVNNIEQYTKANAKQDSKLQEVYEELYFAKQKIISNSLFGVDVNPKSIKIARLRLWIEMLKHIHFTKESNYKNLVLLPNIDINIKQGNSLISKFDLDYEFDTLFEHDFFKQYKELIKAYKNPKNDRDSIKEELSKIKSQLDIDFENKNKFEWRYEFPEVLDENGKFLGFDVVIGNPPYIQLTKIKDINYSKHNYQTFQKDSDIYILFVEKSLKLLNVNGYASLITSNSWLKTKYGEKLKDFLTPYTTQVFDFKDTQIFEDATVESSIININLKVNQPNFEVVNIEKFDSKNIHYDEFLDILNASRTSSHQEELLKIKIENSGDMLGNMNIDIKRGITTGCNEAFIIDTQTKDELIKKDPKSAQIIKPILRGKDIQRYSYSFEDKWLINVSNGFVDSVTKSRIGLVDINNYQDVKKYLDQYYKLLEVRQDKGITPYNLRNCAYESSFNEPKIIWGEISDKPKFTYDEQSTFLLNTGFMMTGDNLKYILAIINSKLINWYFEKVATTTGEGTTRWLIYKVASIPIANTDNETIENIEKIVSEILALKKQDKSTMSLENKIDKMVYELYGLDKDEISIIEKNDK
jgi:hypothetical protein